MVDINCSQSAVAAVSLMIVINSTWLFSLQGNQILFNVSGVFYEIRQPTGSNRALRKVLRCFTRSMILVAPAGHIMQDDLLISNPSESLIQVKTDPLPTYEHFTGT